MNYCICVIQIMVKCSNKCQNILLVNLVENQSKYASFFLLAYYMLEINNIKMNFEISL